ncbi:MAG: hypothetical protein NC334_09020 [Bacteroides sp.]|nr:hypothetical protein [Bacteroides sp.]
MPDKKTIFFYGLVYAVIQALLNWGIFVTVPQMVAYAAPKDSIEHVQEHLVRIENKIDKILIKGN